MVFDELIHCINLRLYLVKLALVLLDFQIDL